MGTARFASCPALFCCQKIDKIKTIVNENTATIGMGGVCRDVNMAFMGAADESMIGKHFPHVGYVISEIS